MTQLRDLSVIIPSYNARALLRRTLRTLAVAAPEVEVIVVDGASRDGSADMVRDEFPSVQVLSYPNHGFAHAVNRGLEAATRDAMLVLNSDLFVSRAALESMKDRLDGDRWVGAVGPVLLNEDGTRQHSFGSFYWPNWAPVRTPTRVPLLSGACVMTRRDVLREIGGLDETFFLYNEEYDWCARLKAAGFQLEMVPERVVHVGGGSTTRAPELVLEAQRGFLYLAQKHAPGPVVEGLRLLMLFEGFSKSRIDVRPQYRSMWKQLEQVTRTEDYVASPFPVSGRGSEPARPNWVSMDIDSAFGHRAAPITRTQPMAPLNGSVVNGSVVNGSVVNLSSERARRAAKAVGATG